MANRIQHLYVVACDHLVWTIWTSKKKAIAERQRLENKHPNWKITVQHFWKPIKCDRYYQYIE